MDYFLGDALMPCPGTEQAFSETVYRLPVLCSYRPFANVPIAAAPCLENGYITFGSFNSPRKITREVAKLWSAILHLVPGSRLLLKYGGLDTEAMQERFYPWFMEDGIPPERLRFEGAVPPREYLEAFRNIDIANAQDSSGNYTFSLKCEFAPPSSVAAVTSAVRTGAN